MTKLILPHLAESALFVHSLLHSGIKDSISSSSDKGQHFLNCTVRRVQMDQEVRAYTYYNVATHCI